MKSINERISELAGTHHAAEIARRLDLSPGLVNWRLEKLGITPLPYADATSPTDGEWIGAAMKASISTGVPLKHILAGGRDQHVVRARWLAFKILLDEYPDYTVIGLGRTSGFHHATILHGLARLAGKPPRAAARPSIDREAA